MAPTTQEFSVNGEAEGMNIDKGERVVISGMSGLFPNAHNVADLSTILYNKINPITSDNLRFNYTHPELTKHFGMVPEIQHFDAQFFRVHYRLGLWMDPMCRKLLEQAYQAIYDAGVCPEELSGKKVGVYIGACLSETEKSCLYVFTSGTSHAISGCSKAMFAHRISYWLNAKGPSVNVDQACCSSIAALEAAYQDFQQGDCEAAIVGGSNLILHPQSLLLGGRNVKLSMDGKTRSFDENADGCAKSEAINVLFLQKAKDARRIYAEVMHVKSEFTSLLNGEMGPRYDFSRNPKDNIKFLEGFYKEVNVPPQVVEYVEGFGSALPDADKAELEAIENIFCKRRSDPLLVGSVISNVGYGDAASGITAITKVLLGYHKGKLAANLNCTTPRRDIAALQDGRMRIVTEHADFRRTYVAVNGYSITGVNSHVLLKGHYKPKDKSCYKSELPYLVLISGRQESAVEKVLEYLKYHPIDPEELALLHNFHISRISGNLGRGFSVLGTNKENETITLSKEVSYLDYVKRPLWFVYSGMGSQWVGMGEQLMRIPIFATAIHRCHRVLQPKGLDLINIITGHDKTILDNILHSFVGITAIQIGLTDVLTALGLAPDMIIGHSAGEVACAYADGCFSAEETILSAYCRGLVSMQIPFIRGAMAAVGIGYQRMVSLCPPGIDVACHNSPDSCTISGPADLIQMFTKTLGVNNIFAKEVQCSNIAYHSRYIKEAGPALLKSLNEVIKSPRLRSERWVSTSVPMDKWDEDRAKYSSAEYHTNNMLSPVLFEETSRLIPTNAVLVEVAPHGLLQAILKRSLPSSCCNIPLTRRAHSDNVVFLLDAIGKLYLQGFNPNVQALYPKIEYPVSTETPMLSHLVEWTHEEKWSLTRFESATRTPAASAHFLISLYDDEHEYLQGHVIRGKVLYPFAAVLVAVWDTLAMSCGMARRKMPVQFQDVELHVQPALHERRLLRLAVTLHRCSGRFEVMDDINSKVASGFINSEITSEPSQEETEKTYLEVSSEEIYNNFISRDFCYRDSFKSIHSVNSDTTEALILWRDNWATFLDGIIQLNLLRHSLESHSYPCYIHKLSIDPTVHCDNTNTFKATVYGSHSLTRCGGVHMENIKFRDLPMSENSATLRALKIIPPFNTEQLDVATEHAEAKNGRCRPFINVTNLDVACTEETVSADELREDYFVPVENITNSDKDVTLRNGVIGQLEYLHWEETSLRQEHRIPIKVHYAGLNDLDAKRAAGLIPFENCNTNKEYGMDFSGITESGKRVMGLVASGAVGTCVQAYPELLWPVPEHWSLEDAATVPLAYCLAYYCLTIKYPLYKGARVLVHAGAGALGQAIIAIALANDCEVFATVGNVRKKQFLLKMFPALKADNIGSSNDISFRDMVLNATNSNGVNYLICNLHGELKTASLKCLGETGLGIDMSVIPERESYNLSMECLSNERSLFFVNFSSIFNKNGNTIMKQLQRLVGEGIARGWVRPLSRVVYEPNDAIRAFRMLAGGNQRGRVLLRLRNLHTSQPDATCMLPRVQCSPDKYHVIISDHEYLGQLLADKLVSRGVRKLYLYTSSSPKDLKLKLRQWQSVGVQVCSETLCDTNEIPKTFIGNRSPKLVEGIYIIITNKNKSTSESAAFVEKLDLTSRQTYPNVKYFAVINTLNSIGTKSCISRVQNQFAGTMIKLPKLKQIGDEQDIDGERITANAAIESIEFALCSTAPALRAAVPRQPRLSMLQQLANIAGVTITPDTKDTATLSELGMDPAKLNIVCVYLRDMYNLFLNLEDIQTLSVQRIKEIDETLTKTTFDDDKGLKTFYSSVASDELIGINDMILLPTLTSDPNVYSNEIDENETYLCIIPGVEGHYARFRLLCERLKLPALVLQPGLHLPHETVPETARRYAKILLDKAGIKTNFYLLGYESGVLVALEVAALLEDHGLTGTVFCVGPPPAEFNTELREHLSGLETEEALEDAVVQHMFTLLTGNEGDELREALKGAKSWEEKVEAAVRLLLGHVSHSMQYVRQLIEAARGRLIGLQRYETTAHPLRSRLVLLRPAPAPACATALQPHSQQPVTAHSLPTSLAHVLQDLRCSTIINSNLSDNILQAFQQRNLCDSYQVLADLLTNTCN